jgi:hypothetical protein
MPRATKKPQPRSPYGVHPAVLMTQRWVETLADKTGRSLEQWVELINQEGPADEKQRREWLKEQFGLGTNTAWWLAERAAGRGAEDDNPESYLRAAPGYVDALYTGGKAGLRPLHDQLAALGLALGDDVKLCPCKTIVPLYRNHVFAEIKPATRTRIDFGLALKGQKVGGRLIDTGGEAKKDRITHRFAITCPADIDAEVKRWLKIAYDLDA